MVDDLKKTGSGIVIADLSGVGELTSTASTGYDHTAKLHTLARAELWLGRTLLGQWVKELELITQFVHSHYKAQKVSIDGSREAGLAALFLGALDGNVESITLRDAPVSYLFDNRESVSFFSMGIHLPGILKWGDVSLAAALGGKDITFINPVSMSGTPLDADRLKESQAEFDKIRNNCGSKGKKSLVKLK